MDTPIYDFLRSFDASGMLRACMPGHKGISPVEGLEEVYGLDLTEIKGADSLFEADGIIAESERNASKLYGTAATVYSAGGSTLCIQAMLALMKQEKRHIIAVRNVHRSFLNAVALLGLDVQWLLPEYSGGILSGRILLPDVESALAASTEPACLYVTSPDYTGRMADIAALAALCHRYGARLLVDNAHGAHLAFFEKSMHPINAGADLCCDSSHKMLPALTGAALLHTSCSEYAPKLKQAMSLFGSTSPSYLIMASLDICNRYISDNIRGDIVAALPRLNSLREALSDRLSFAESEPFHITIKAAESGYSGTELAELLRNNGVECEYADEELLVLLMSPFSPAGDYGRLSAALESSVSVASLYTREKPVFLRELPNMACAIREAAFAPAEEISVEAAEGRVCASVKLPCPPAVPIAVSGEIISKECIEVYRSYGIKTVLVVKN
ncbi:aminotransferase class I/II-fold pyridoxal phosphate-dependent enzyme [Ruminococcus sp.]|uniref:aminotransferase class I/II-fold pyridoxal phosphate-dependent enzyme n=1 Tax=Ruminococcus sp. TaxID=41978 RepID=UPI001B7C834A|nr:aminotransferase class I/II-fold pyridoxal phosphate-dependent enzyme [Ruminococcus sp.]MBP5432681.1 aminotransferase class I/II-fold pyridoxal phosphate-dependent enzyme [Ruminococcus sp.]